MSPAHIDDHPVPRSSRCATTSPGGHVRVQLVERADLILLRGLRWNTDRHDVRRPGTGPFSRQAQPGSAEVALGCGAGRWLRELGPGSPDRALVDLVQQARTPALDVCALVLRYGLSVPVAIGWLVLAGAVLWVGDRGPRRAVALVSLAIPGWLVTAAVKTVVERPRPRGVALFGQLQEVGPHSFPSAHAAIGAGVACAVVLVFCWPRGAMARVVGMVLGLGFAVAAGWSRVYLGVHHPGDVLGSIGLTVAAELVWLPVLTRLLHPPGHDGVDLRRSGRR